MWSRRPHRLLEGGRGCGHLTHVDVFEVPGSFEIPLHAQVLAKTRRYTAIVAAGLVVDGGIYRHEFVADTVIKALMDVQLRTEVPVFSAVLTPQQFHETEVHYDFFRRHFAGSRASRSRPPAPRRCTGSSACAARSPRGSWVRALKSCRGSRSEPPRNLEIPGRRWRAAPE